MKSSCSSGPFEGAEEIALDFSRFRKGRWPVGIEGRVERVKLHGGRE